MNNFPRYTPPTHTNPLSAYELLAKSDFLLWGVGTLRLHLSEIAEAHLADDIQRIENDILILQGRLVGLVEGYEWRQRRK